MTTASATPVAFDNRKVLSLETLTLAQLEPALYQIEVALGYVERLVTSVDDTGEQYNKACVLLRDLRKARSTIETIKDVLRRALKYEAGEITYFG
jgi:hypothetical protein